MNKETVITRWTEMLPDTEYTWCGGIGSFASENTTVISSKPTGFTDFIVHDELSFPDADGGFVNFQMPRGTIIKSSAKAFVAPAEDNDLRTPRF